MSDARFIFERDFDRELDSEQGVSPPSERMYSESEVQTKIQLATEAAYARGQDAGWRTAHTEAMGQAERQHLAALEQLGSQLRSLMEGEANHRSKLEDDVVALVKAVLTKVLPDLQSQLSRTRLENEILAHVKLALGSSTLRIRVSTLDLPQLKDTILRKADTLGVTSRIQISSDAALSQGECRVDWDDGFMEFGFEKVCRSILELLQADPEQPAVIEQELKQKYA
ncbi:flagellar assembly protein H [Roseivivax sp. THAF40]|uniref:FliH/SctL family protein n=1 Tax=Roseivivax sp. THAF40 TaxID=2587858 RepID=UPI001268ABC0|nr:FliH/SctL family protein [Roseivivax sp. THAF40]QFT47379.1 flagellar assembly protein H [Roseivivax sp. THAF40]